MNRVQELPVIGSNLSRGLPRWLQYLNWEGELVILITEVTVPSFSISKVPRTPTFSISFRVGSAFQLFSKMILNRKRPWLMSVKGDLVNGHDQLAKNGVALRGQGARCHQRRCLYTTEPPSPGLSLTSDFPEAPTPFPVPSLGCFGKTKTGKEVTEFASSS